MKNLTTTTRVGNATITVTGVFAHDTITTLKDILKSLIQRHIMSDYGVDLSENLSEYSKQAKEVKHETQFKFTTICCPLLPLVT